MNETTREDLLRFTADGPPWVQTMLNDILDTIETAERTTLSDPSVEEKLVYHVTTKKKFSRGMTDISWPLNPENGLKKIKGIRVSLYPSSSERTQVLIFTTIINTERTTF